LFRARNYRNSSVLSNVIGYGLNGSIIFKGGSFEHMSVDWYTPLLFPLHNDYVLIALIERELSKITLDI
jgi:hypothetical protein